MVGSGVHDGRIGGALQGLADGIEALVDQAEEMREQIFHLTWGYAHPDKVLDGGTG
jgi:hypothetical protein